MNPKLEGNLNLMEANKPSIKLSYFYKDSYGRFFGSFESHNLDQLEEPTSKGAVFFDASIETQFGNFMLDCKITDAKMVLPLISDFVKKKEQIKQLGIELEQEKVNLEVARNKFRLGGEPNYAVSKLVDELQRNKQRMELELQILEEKLEGYKV